MTTTPPPGFDPQNPYSQGQPYPPQGQPYAPPPPAPNPKKKRRVWVWVLGVAVVGLLAIGLQPADEERSSSGSSTKSTASLPKMAPGSRIDAAVGCGEAPVKIVEIINANFTNGEHLENAQSVSGPSGKVIVGGNIVAPDGTRVSSADSWVMSGGQVYGLSSDARRHTLLADGRDVLGDNWTTYNDAVGDCVLKSTRAGNR